MSLHQFQSIISEFQSDIDSYIQAVNNNIDDLLKFNSFVTSCVKSYLCKYIRSLSNQYCSSYNSIKQNIDTFKCIQECVKAMSSELNRITSTGTGGLKGKGSSGSELYLQRAFRYVSDKNYVKNTFDRIKANLPVGSINSINIYLTMIEKFLDESNPINTTIWHLDSLKNLVSQFGGHIENYNTRIGGILIPRIYSLVKSESTIKQIKSIGNGSAINNKYESIKPKVKYCESSLKFELQRLQSILNNAKMLQKHLEKIIGMIKKYQTNVTKLKEKLEKMKQNKDQTMKYLCSIVRKIIYNLYEIESISNCLKCRKDRVSISTIKQDIAYINLRIEDINNILPFVKSDLYSLVRFSLGIDSKLLNEIESCILGIVCGIHRKYCNLTTDLSTIFTDQPTPGLTTICQLPEIKECLCAAATSSCGEKGAQNCETCQSGQDCPCCSNNCDSLKQLLTTSCSVSDIGQRLKSVKNVICRLTDGKPYDGCQTLQGQQCSNSCQNNQTQTSSACVTTTQTPGTTSNTCQETKIRELIKSTLEEIKQCETSSSTPTCQTSQITTDSNCQTASSQPPPSCSSSTSGIPISCNELGKVKLCLDTMVNKCNCQNLKEFLEIGKINSSINLFKSLIIYNFMELFNLYSCFDKSILNEISCLTEKLVEMRFYLIIITFIHSEIKCWIDSIKNQMNESIGKVGGLVNTMRSRIKISVSDLECAIEGVPRNQIRCSLQTTNNRTVKVFNSNLDIDLEKPVMSIYSVINVMDYRVLVNRLYDSAKNIDNILKLVPWYDSCQCILMFESFNIKVQLQIINLFKIMDNMSIQPMNKFLGLDKIRQIHELRIGPNHSCLCMIVKYNMYPSIIKCIQTIGIDLNMLSTLSRKFTKYRLLECYTGDLIKILTIVINLVDKISTFIERRYLWATSKVKVNPGLICFCRAPDDKYYHLILNMLLVLSSLLENVWTMNPESTSAAIRCLSSLINEYEKITKDNSDMRWNNCKLYIYQIVVNKLCCKKPEGACDEKCCCVTFLIIILMSVYICISFKIKNKLCPTQCDLIKKRLFCFIKLVCNSKNGDCPKLTESCEKVFNISIPDCCQKLLESCKQICESSSQNNTTNCNLEVLIKKCTELCTELTKVCAQDCICKEMKETLTELCKALKECKVDEVLKCIDKCCKTGGCKCSKCKVVGHMINVMRKNMILIEYNVKHDIKFNSLTHGSRTRIALSKNIKSLYFCHNKLAINLVKNNHSSYGTGLDNITHLTSLRNWGYDTRYEHSATPNNSFSDSYPCVKRGTIIYGGRCNFFESRENHIINIFTMCTISVNIDLTFY